MIEIIQGTLGSGKSAVALLRGLLHLSGGGVLATNFKLVDDWAYQYAGQNFLSWVGLRDKDRYAKCLHNRCYHIGEPSTIYDLSERLDELVVGKAKNRREGKGLLIIDEAQLYFNSRDFQKNMPFIEFFTQSRKLGWDIILVAHSIEMIDKQIRPLIELESRFRNLKNVRIPMTPFPLSPVPLFLVVTRYAGLGAGKGAIHSKGLFWFDKMSAQLYDSFEVFVFNKMSDVIQKQGKEPGFIDKKIKKDVNCCPAEVYPQYYKRIELEKGS